MSLKDCVSCKLEESPMELRGATGGGLVLWCPFREQDWANYLGVLVIATFDKNDIENNIRSMYLDSKFLNTEGLVKF